MKVNDVSPLLKERRGETSLSSWGRSDLDDGRLLVAAEKTGRALGNSRLDGANSCRGSDV